MQFSFSRNFLFLTAGMMLAGGAMAADPILQMAAARCAEFETDVHDMRLVQTMKSYATDGVLTFEQTVYIKGKKSRVEMKMPLGSFAGGDDSGAVETIMVNDGTRAWIVSPITGKKELDPEEAAQNAPARNCWGAFPDDARVTGSETIDARDCHIVEMIEEDVTTRIWLDKRNFVPVKGEARDTTGTGKYQWTHSEFHRIHGEWEYPYRTEMYDGVVLAATVDVTSLVANGGLSDDLFDPDKVEVQPLDLEDLMKLMAAPVDTLEGETTE